MTAVFATLTFCEDYLLLVIRNAAAAWTSSQFILARWLFHVVETWPLLSTQEFSKPNLWH